MFNPCEISIPLEGIFKWGYVALRTLQTKKLDHNNTFLKSMFSRLKRLLNTCSNYEITRKYQMNNRRVRRV